jgi:hypothetical protein
MNLKTKILIGVCIAAAFGMVALAATPLYTSKNATGYAAAPSTVIFPSDPSSQIRLVNVSYQSDSNTAVLSYSSGVGAYTVLNTNTTTGLTNIVTSTAGMVTGSVMVLEHLGVGYFATLSSTNNGTNAVLASGGWGVTPAVGDNLYQMGTASTVFVGSNGTATAVQNGEALFVGNYGRPVMIQLSPALVTNRLNNVTARYE